jgi:hypothetical protein
MTPRRRKNPVTDELTELHENAEHGAEHSGLAPVTISMAILAVLVAVISLLGHDAHTEELLAETKATDQWAQYQAKSIREHSYKVFLDELGVFTVQNPSKTEELKVKYGKEVDRYDGEMKEIQEQATDTEKDVNKNGRRGDRYDLAEVMLESALVICSITLLTHKKMFWAFGLLIAAGGIVIAATSLLIK